MQGVAEDSRKLADSRNKPPVLADTNTFMDSDEAEGSKLVFHLLERVKRCAERCTVHGRSCQVERIGRASAGSSRVAATCSKMK